MNVKDKDMKLGDMYSLLSRQSLVVSSGEYTWSLDYENPDCYYKPKTGELAVLYCPRVSPGWSTQRNGYDILATDKKLIQMVLNEEPYEAAVKRLEELGFDMSEGNVRDIYRSLRIEYIPRGEWYFIQRSHFGSEYIIRQHNMKQA